MKSSVPSLRLLFLLAGSLLAVSAFSQPLEVTDGATNPYTPQNLITNVFLGDGVEVTNITFDGPATAVGYFQNGEDYIGIDRGVVMTTGAVSSGGFTTGVDNFGSSFASSNNGGGTSTDPDLIDIASPMTPMDHVIYRITFVPVSDTLRFNFVWASEEYPEYACSAFNDVFGFFISGPGISGPYENNGINIALVPGTSLPVSIDNVHPQNGGGCPPVNEQYYVDNNGSNTYPVYDGYTTVFTAEAVVTPCEEYTIKLAISDAGDGIFDSGVFLEAKSFGTGSLDVDIATASLDGTITEGCANATLTFSLPEEVENDFPIDYNIFGSAINGVDYTNIPPDLFIAAGDTSVSITIEGFEDFIDEVQEFIGIDVQRDVCNRDTFYIYIRDNELIPPDLGPDITQCETDTAQLDGTINIPLPPPPTFTNVNDFEIDPPFANVLSPIQVAGVQPFELGPGVIQSVCVDIDHNWLSDLDLFLVGPNGAFIELSTDNGSDGNDYTGTCFTPTATTPIDYIDPPASGAPYTGDFAIEGVWSDLWSAQENPTNGEWNLLLIDDAMGFAGDLLEWSITFEPLYNIYYSWEPTAGLSCTTCPDPLASPDTTTTYILTAYDSYGCETYDTITITVETALPAPDVICSTVTDTCITFSWDPIPGAMGYEVNVDGMGWELANGATSHTVCGLTFDQEVTIEVRAIDDCSGFIGTATCTTPDCVSATPSVDLVTDVSCNGGIDGEVNLSAIGNYPPFTFTLGADENQTGVFTGLSADTYEVTVTDDVDCATVITVTVEEPDPIVLNPVVIDEISCFGADDGVATITVTGGNYPYSFDWNTAQNDSVAVDLPAGDQVVEVTDATGCSQLITFPMNEPTQIQLNGVSSVVTCNGGDDGTATVIPVGGTAPYTYEWSDPLSQDEATADSLIAGTYNVIVTDDNGCSENIDVDVSENTPIVLDFDLVDATCNGFDDGSATVSASGGGINLFLYQWDANANSQTTPTASDLTVGTYYVTVTDFLDCSVIDSVVIDAPNAMDIALAVDSTSCFDATDGSASVSVSGGTPNYTYAWSDGGAPTPDRDDLSSGPQQVTVTDDNGCFEVLDFEILAPEPVEVMLDATAVDCNDGTTGTATVTVSGGDGNYSYLWDDAQVTPTATNLPAGMIGVTVSDGNGCEASGMIEVVEPSEIELDITGTDALCFGDENGTATVVATGGEGTYTYQWDDTDNQTTSTALDLPAGSYSVTVTDGNGCEAEGSILLGEPPVLESSTGFTPLSCDGGPDGTATVTPMGGTGNYSYQWSDNQATQTAVNLNAETYFVTVTDDNNCSVVDTVTLTAPDLVTLALNVSDVSCFDGEDGTVSVEVLTGTGPYDYTWNNGGSNSSITGLEAGQYTVTVVDQNDCEATASINVTQPEALNANLSQEASLCHDGNDGEASVDAIFYGNTNADINDFSFDWSAPGQNDATANGLVGGQTYTVTITDPLGCELVETITIDNPEAMEAVITDATDVSCWKGDDGIAVATANGGTGVYSYQWDNATGAQVGETATDLSAGTYFVTATDENGCEATTSVDIGQPTQLENAFVVDDVDCYGESNGTVNASVDGGTEPYTLSWSTGQSGFLVDALSAGTYDVTILDGNGCELVQQVEVTQPAEPVLTNFTAEDVSCVGYRDGSIFLSSTGGTAPYSYSLDGENYVGTDELLGLEPGSYNVIVQDANGCEYITGDIFIDAPDPLTVDLGPDIEVDYGETALLSGEVSGNAVYYEWIPLGIHGVECYDCPETLTDTLENTAYYKLIVQNENGCEGEDVVRILVNKDPKAFVPTGFTPNGDGQNDLLLVHGKEGTTVQLFQIFDRWGELVYQRGNFDVNDPNIGWDGSFRGQDMNSGVYIWHLEVIYEDGEVGFYKGGTTLIR